MKGQTSSARAFFLVAGCGFLYAGWREQGIIAPLIIIPGAVLLILVARHNARKRGA